MLHQSRCASLWFACYETFALLAKLEACDCLLLVVSIATAVMLEPTEECAIIALESLLYSNSITLIERKHNLSDDNNDLIGLFAALFLSLLAAWPSAHCACCLFGDKLCLHSCRNLFNSRLVHFWFVPVNLPDTPYHYGCLVFCQMSASTIYICIVLSTKWVFVASRRPFKWIIMFTIIGSFINSYSWSSLDDQGHH